MRKSGFTLIELLVVISIIAILATIGLTIYTGAQKSGRVAKRVEDLRAIRTALEIYYSQNGSYPVVIRDTDTIWRSECSAWGSLASDIVIPNASGFPSFIPNYMVAFPRDPSMNTVNNTNCYIYRSNGIDYKVLDHVITDFEANRSDLAGYLSQRNLVDPARDGGTDPCKVDGTAPWSWAVYSSATSACW